LATLSAGVGRSFGIVGEIAATAALAVVVIFGTLLPRAARSGATLLTALHVVVLAVSSLFAATTFVGHFSSPF
jgi:hypothetical protein